ncbi:MAG: ADP-ribosylglycohydrolase family protein [Opitutales bacterium]
MDTTVSAPQSATEHADTLTLDTRSAGMLAGVFIGDALAMPAHWYYDPAALAQDYGEIRDYLAPRNPHPFSILWRSQYQAPTPKGEILHAQARYWGQRDVHYHQFLRAGENTLTVKLARLLWTSLNERRGWNADDYLQRYINFLTTPGQHNDTYLEECHRNFFANYAREIDPRHCAAVEKHIGGLAALFPILAYDPDRLELAREQALERLHLTHPGPRMRWAAETVFNVLERLRAGHSATDAAHAVLLTIAPEVTRKRWQHLFEQETRTVLNRSIGTVCYVEQAIPAILYVMAKHGANPEQALIENTMAGGDNVHRGSVLGALLGYAHGFDVWPQRWRAGLVEGIPFAVGDD